MTRSKHSIDGFVSRRTGAPLEGLPKSNAGLPSVQMGSRREIGQARSTIQAQPAKIQSNAETNSKGSRGGISRSEIDESLQGIDVPKAESQKRKHRISGKQVKRFIKWLLILLLVVGIGIGTYVGIKALTASGNIFKGNVFDIIQNKPLKMDESGRTNIIVLGTSEDDPGHKGAALTDSMMIVSVDQNKKNAFMISIPRDLYVKFGQACPTGYQSKINSYFSCVGGDPSNIEATRQALTKEAEFIGEIFGLQIQYGVNLNYSVLRDLVNAVGGTITVNIESRDPRGVLDSNFDWHCGKHKLSKAEQIRRCPPKGNFIDYPIGPATLDAEHALYLAQARGEGGGATYGLEQSNFDREKNQQKIVKALREKAVSAGVVTDFGKVASILDALGNNLRTTFEASEVRTLVALARDIKSEDIQSLSLNDPDKPLMITGNAGGASIVRPAAGLFDYSDIQAFIKQELTADPVMREKANVSVYNGSGVTGAAQVEADKLAALGMVVGQVTNAPEGDYGKATIYQLDKTKTATAAKLEELYGVKAKATPPPVTVTGDTAFVVIIGTVAKASDATTAN